MKILEERKELTEQEIAKADARLLSHAINLGYATGLDNESIDADLANEYGDDHASLYQKSKK
jgi:hypothetical protein